MDSLILSLTPDQHRKYLALVGKEQIELDFEIKKTELDAYSDDKIKKAKRKIIAECDKILKLQKRDSFFFTPLNKEEIQRLIPVYFEAIRSISKTQRELYGEAVEISRKINVTERMHCQIAADHSNFLPYKAAFGKSEKYAAEISNIDAEFLKEISKITEHKSSLARELERISTLCDLLIPDFFKKSSLAADSPKFKGFNDKAFFSELEAFIERVKNV